MNTGIQLIAEERKEQIEKHGFDVSRDTHYSDNELIKAALFCINSDVFEWPFYWDEEYRIKILSKEDPVERWKIAGAFIAAHIDRHLLIEQRFSKPNK